MYATIRRYEAVDQARTSELIKKAQDTLLPRMSELPGFNGYSLIDTGNGVLSSIGFFDTSAHADDSARIASTGCARRSSRTHSRTRRRSPAVRS